MCSISSEKVFYVGRQAIRLFVISLMAAMLAACAQSSVVSNKNASLAGSRWATLGPSRAASVLRTSPAPYQANKPTAGSPNSLYGLASFYTEGSHTASGEKFDGQELTAAHRTLPFGTRLRVTNVANGRSVTVRINDRGPFVPGRVVDVSYVAARTLGITQQGVAKVKLDVVH
jgi:rare lipoprotein A